MNAATTTTTATGQPFRNPDGTHARWDTRLTLAPFASPESTCVNTNGPNDFTPAFDGAPNPACGFCNRGLEHTVSLHILLTAREVSSALLADLPANWENATVDTHRYYQNVMMAWEVDEASYRWARLRGNLCQRVYTAPNGALQAVDADDQIVNSRGQVIVPLPSNATLRYFIA